MLDGGGLTMNRMDKADADLVYKYVRDGFRGDLEADAYQRALDDWREYRADDLDHLEAMADAEESAFSWDRLWLELVERDFGDREVLLPRDGLEPRDETPRTTDLASEFGYQHRDEVRNEVRRRQAASDYSPREFVALVLDAAENCPENLARREMDVSLGNYRGKKGDVTDKLEQAKRTVAVTDRVRG
jgi:hypothetical protein